MTRALLLSAAFAAALAVSLSASAQTGPDNDTGFVVPTDGRFDMPDVTWIRNVIAFWWLLPFVLVSVGALWLIQWVDGDARHVGLDPMPWNYAGLALAVASLASFFLLPPWLSIPVVAAAFSVMLWKYVPARNARVMHTRQLFTKEHRLALKKRFYAAFGIRPAGAEKRLARIAKEHVPVALFDAKGGMVSAADASYDEEDPISEVKEVVGQAAARHAREVEIVPGAGRVAVSYAIDGLAHAGPVLDRLRGSAAMLVMKKHLADPASAAPQFRIQLPTLKRACTVHVSVYGQGDAEWMRLRLVDDGETMLRLGQLGLPEDQLAALRAALDSARGLMAVAGPAAMGARTTTYAMLDSLDAFSRTIVTFERPIAGRLESIDQREMPDNETLAATLAELVRREVNLVMMSEIPDAAAAQIALTAAERDQIFLARFELPDASAVPPRLIERGASPAAVAAGLHTIVAQRLARRLCAACRRKVAPPAGLLQKIGADLSGSRVEFLWEESSGCDACGHTGFRGRVGFFEIWQPSAGSRRLIEQNAPADQLHAAALRDGMRSLQHSGLALVLSGVTSLREIARVLKIV